MSPPFGLLALRGLYQLSGMANTADVIGASVAVVARDRGVRVVTSDLDGS